MIEARGRVSLLAEGRNAVSSPLVAQLENCRIEYYRGDWPPKGARVRWVAGILEYDDRVAMVCVTGRGWYWPASPLMDGEVPWDALERAASYQSGGLVAWARPVAVITVHEADEATGDVLQVFAGQLQGEPSRSVDPLVEHVNLVPYDEAEDVLSILAEDVPVVASREMIDDLVAAARAEIEAGPGPALFTEARHHVFSPPTFYHCRLVSSDGETAVLEYRGKRAGSIKGVQVPVGSRTVARYTSGADAIPWVVYGPDDERLCAVIHMADRIRVGRDRVTYRDLLVDVFIDAAGNVSIQDRDDLQRALSEGLLDEAQAVAILASAERVARDPDAILDGLPQG